MNGIGSRLEASARQFAALRMRPREDGDAPLAVACVTETYPPEINGVAHTVQRAVQHLVERGHAVQLIRPRQGAHDGARGQDGPGARISELLTGGIPLPMYPDLRMGLARRSTLVRLWRLARPDVVHVATEGPLGGAAVAAARKLAIPVASEFRTNFHLYSEHYRLGLARPLALAYLRWFHNRTQTTMVPTARLADELARLGFANIRVVGRGVDAERFSPQRRSAQLRAEWGASERDTVVLYVGRLAPEKNVALALRAFEAMRRREPSARLVMVGDGPQRNEIEGMRAPPILTGWRRGEALAQCYASADVFLFPSMTDTFGNVVVEALASGLAVLAFDEAAAAEHIQDGRNGFVVPRGDAAAYVAAAERLAGDAGRLRAVRQRARDTGIALAWPRVLALFERSLAAMVTGKARADYAANLAGAA
jgi:glycosyltransferase involved in cell wall biosynthesis